MAFFDELKKNLSGVSGTVAKTSETVIRKSGHVVEIQKAKLRKVSLENDLKNLYAQLGELYFDNYAAGDMPKEMAAVCEKVTACQHAIDEAEQRVSLLKGVVICSNCQTEVDKNASYCPQCGAEIVHMVEENETETVEAEEEVASATEAAAETEEAAEPEAAEEEVAAETEVVDAPGETEEKTDIEAPENEDGDAEAEEKAQV